MSEPKETAASAGTDPRPPQLTPAVFRVELEALAARNPRVKALLEDGRDGDEALHRCVAEGRPSAALGLTGLALSGGGIRSATFNLGVLQALQRRGVPPSIDYLSTVSGGGYIGSCLSANLAGNPDPPFRHEPGGAEPATLRHLRAYSNYLAPRGLADLLQFPALLLRGVLINLFSLFPYVLLAAVVTVLLAGNTILCPYDAAVPADCPLFSDAFHYTLRGLVAFALWLLAYPILQRFSPLMRKKPWKVREGFGRLNGYLFILLVAVALLELQPLAIHYLIQLKTVAAADLIALVSGATAVLSLLSGKVLRRITDLTGRIGIYLVGLLGPLLLWLIYLLLCAWALRNHPVWIYTLRYRSGVGMYNLFSDFTAPLIGLGRVLSAAGEWFTVFGSSVLLVYLVAALLILAYSTLLIDVNRTSLHKFYRDRLSKAYLFTTRRGGETEALKHQDDLRMSALSASNGPYHLINVTLNHRPLREDGDATADDTDSAGPADTGASAQAREDRGADGPGRRATFFIFSPLHVGSERTGYCETRLLERADPEIDLGTCMAISGAAASPNMGTVTMRPLMFVMAMLNVRLGYWLINPGRLAHTRYHFLDRHLRYVNRVGPVYLLREMVGLVGLDSKYVNLSDGGHLENLGVFELLRRRCRHIIACDAEADAGLGFGGLATLMRLAGIDLGVEIRIALEAIEPNEDGLSRCHCAFGTIDYGDGVPGTLLYIKSSVTGHESLPIREYRERTLEKKDGHPFPHETTADQFFDEAQFEAYRALGEHIVERLWAGEDASCPTAADPALTARQWLEGLREPPATARG